MVIKAFSTPNNKKMNPPEKLLTTDNPALRQRAKAMRKEMSEAEAKLWQHLRAGRLNGYKFRRQQPMGNYIVDFMCVTPKLIVEADGGQHTEQAAYDHARTAYLNSLGFTVQAAFPISVTRAGFPPVHRLSAAKFRGSKNAAR